MSQVVVIIHLMPVYKVVEERFRVFKCHIYLLAMFCDRSSCHTFVATPLKSTIGPIPLDRFEMLRPLGCFDHHSAIN